MMVRGVHYLIPGIEAARSFLLAGRPQGTQRSRRRQPRARSSGDLILFPTPTFLNRSPTSALSSPSSSRTWPQFLPQENPETRPCHNAAVAGERGDRVRVAAAGLPDWAIRDIPSHGCRHEPNLFFWHCLRSPQGELGAECSLTVEF